MEVKFLSVIIDYSIIHINPIKVKAITDWPTPMRVKKVQAFLSLTNFYWQFIWNYSGQLLELTTLLKKDIKFKWMKVAKEFFMVLK